MPPDTDLMFVHAGGSWWRPCPGQRWVWHPISSAAPAAPSAPPLATLGPYPDKLAGEQGGGWQHRMRRSHSVGNSASQAPPSPSRPTDDGKEGSGEALPPSDDDRPVTDDRRSRKPRRVIDQSVSIAQMEELGCTLVVSVVTEQQEDLSAPLQL